MKANVVNMPIKVIYHRPRLPRNNCHPTLASCATWTVVPTKRFSGILTNNSKLTPRIAPKTSNKIKSGIGIRPKRTAPSAGAIIMFAEFTTPSWPFTRVNWSPGTMVGKIAWIVGIWNVCANARTSNDTKISQTGKKPPNSPTALKISATIAATISGTINNIFLFKRSI